jgi:predicted amidohydrolase
MENNTSRDIGRPVRITSVGFANGKSLPEIIDVVDREGARGTDLIALPETWLGQQDDAPETLEGTTIPAMASLASKHRTYVVCPLDRWDGHQRFNSAVLLDRKGQVVCVYDKVYPFWSEYDVEPAVTVGCEVPVYQADFGRVGMAICFDVNFPEVWKRLADQGAELVIWPSAYSAGTSLQAHALNHHYYIATATQKADCVVYDITGEEILYEKSDDLNVSRFTLDLDRGIYHEDFNLERRDRLLQERSDDVLQEKSLTREAWFVLKAKRAGINARALARQYGLEELRDYLGRCNSPHAAGARSTNFAVGALPDTRNSN